MNSNGKHNKAIALALKTLKQAKKELGVEHPDTLTSLNNLALLYQAQDRYEVAEPLLKLALQISQRVLGNEHPDTLASVNNLAGLYESQGRYGPAESLYKRALQVSERVLGKEHPYALSSLGNLSILLTATGKTSEALQGFRALDNRLAFWLNAETTSTQGAAIRRQILANHSGNQNAIFSFALQHPSRAALRFAADLTLRWKKRLTQDAAYLANLIRESEDPKIVQAARIVLERQSAVANAALNPRVTVAAREALKESLEAAEVGLRRASAKYHRFIDVKHATAQQVQDALPADSALIEYRFFNTYDFRSKKHENLHLLAVVLRPSAWPVLVDLGEARPVLALQRHLIDAGLRTKDGSALAKLRRDSYEQLIRPLTKHLKDVRMLIISPDGPLHGLPFDALLNVESQPLLDAYSIHMVQTGRDLVARDRVATGKGLVAFGGIDFAAVKERAEAPAAEYLPDQDTRRSLVVARGELGAFKMLERSGEEVDAIGKLYADRRTDEPAPIIYKGTAATERRLKTLTAPPRVLHLATHGFYLKKESISGRPLLQSGVILAGANVGMKGEFDSAGENGVLHAIEAQTLNLSGTELVVLSACKTGQGVYDYSEGLEGLPRAFHVAGAKNVLVTLWNVGDESTQAFMITFYDYWTRQRRSDPAAALIETKKYFLRHPIVDWRSPQIWAAFVLYEG